jgi:AcrR family transcriptional regulator
MSISDQKAKQRLRRSPLASRENILAAAEAILLEDGPQNLKLAKVAAAAGVVHATVLHHFGSIDGVQSALMARMIEQLVGRVLAITAKASTPGEMASEGVKALFDAFEEKGAARLAAWLELTGESRRLTLVRGAVRQVIDARLTPQTPVTPEVLEDFLLACISIALGVGLFGETLSTLLGKPGSRAREVALALLQARVEQAIAGTPE